MSTEVKTEMKDHKMITYWGGDERGVMVQVTAEREPEGYVKLTFTEAAALANALRDYVLEEAKRRQKLLKDSITELKIAEKTIFHEISELSMATISPPLLAVDLIDTLCPKRGTMHREEMEQSI